MKFGRKTKKALIKMNEQERLDADIRDRQLMRPKVLILAPYRSVAKQVVDEIIRLITPPSGKMEVRRVLKFVNMANFHKI